MTENFRLAVDIGGTFTDVVLAGDGQLFTTKLLTTHAEPAAAVMQGVSDILAMSGVQARNIRMMLHGTTLATNALIERKGASTVLITTEGHRDVLEVGLQNRFDQYDVFMQRPVPLASRAQRLTVRERMSARGDVLLPLTDAEIGRVITQVRASGAESVAIGLLHAWINPDHEDRIAAALAAVAPELPVSLSSKVCPEIREYERLSTTVANAYVQPLMSRYLKDLQRALHFAGILAPLLIMTSGGGLTSLETASVFPVRLIESGPAGGAMLASALARRSGLDRVLAFDMGGTTAKLMLLDDAQPEWTRAFEVARAWKFRKGSGIPVRIPVIEMVEIGAGGGSIAAVDDLRRLQVGPESAGSEPGPAAYDRGGNKATVTDADLVLGWLRPDRFAGGKLVLDHDKAAHAIRAGIAAVLDVDEVTAAAGIADTVTENMAAAARNHAGEWGRDLTGRTLIAFGGSAPLHAAELARRLGIGKVVIPVNAGVGSAVGFLVAPVAFEVVRSRHLFVDETDAGRLAALVTDMRAEAQAVVGPLIDSGSARATLRAWMRYVGQGHEIPVSLPADGYVDGRLLGEAFSRAYASIYGRLIPGQRMEVLSFTFALSGPPMALKDGWHESLEPSMASAVVWESAGWIDRVTLRSGQTLPGPLRVIEDQTTTVVPTDWTVSTDRFGQLILLDTRGEGRG
jgi:N-methylhydantoinase A